MSTFQAIIYGIIQGFSGILPISANGHHVLVPYLLGWPAPTGPFAGALSLGTFLALFVYFRHDWASMISSFLQVLIYRRKPMTIDERIPMFIAAATLPIIAAWYFVMPKIEEIEWTPIMVAGILAAFTLPLWLSEHFSRKNKNMYDWNWFDALVIGVAQIGALVPGAGLISSAIPAALFRNYRREAAAKFALFTAVPVLGAATFLQLRDVHLGTAQPMQGLSWLSFALVVVVSLLSSLLAIGALLKHLQRNGLGQYIVYRWLVAAVVAGFYWFGRRG